MEILLTILKEIWLVTVAMAPYLLFGFLMAGVLSVLISKDYVRRHLGGQRWLQSFKAALFGVPMPICSCGVIPLAASLRKHGASRSATASFLASTPQTGVDSRIPNRSRFYFRPDLRLCRRPGIFPRGRSYSRLH
jgi:uncharacterized membrane protein YraQ (UPF0718 family)